MSYEILYKTFLVTEEDGTQTPYIINGSNNCTELNHNFKEIRERNLNNLFKLYKEVDKTDLKQFLEVVYKDITQENTGFLKGVPKTLNGFINGFYNRIVNKEELLNRGLDMEIYLKNKFKTQRAKPKTVYEINETLTTEFKECSRFNEELKHDLNKVVIVYDKYKRPYNKGKFILRGEDIYFKKSGAKNKLLYLHNFDLYREVVT